MSDFTPNEWCRHRRMSKATYYKLRRLGLAPEHITPPGTSLVRISEAADLAWEQRMQALAQEKATKREAERRRAQTQRAGQIAAQSAAHVSRRLRQKKAAE